MTFAEWIDVTGLDALHNLCGYREGTIRMWKNRNSIPRGVWPDLMMAGLASLRDLLDMEAASK